MLIDRMELRRILSVKRNEELNRQIETGKDLPDIDEAQILAMLEGTLANTGAFIEEAVQEVFEFLRPRNSRYKTNTEFEIGKRVILFAVENKWGGGFRVDHYREQHIRAIDNVFHAMDGNGTIKTHRGPLIDAMEAAKDGRGNRLLQVQVFSEPKPASGVQAAGPRGKTQCDCGWDEVEGRIQRERGQRRLRCHCMRLESVLVMRCDYT